ISEAIEGEPRTVMITGACGNIGRKLRTAWTDVYDLVLIDEVAGEDDPDVIEADLAVLDDDWITHFHGVDTVVHLAANSDAFALTFIALRLGWFQEGKNRPETLPDDWARKMWLSNSDLIRLFDCAVEAEIEDRSFVVVHGMSRNHGMRWDLSDAAELLGYLPIDDAFAAVQPIEPREGSS